jgi:2-polyprenyl-6-methoxyphenol hydroxylase-like FAD-dependent oxidoreductase
MALEDAVVLARLLAATDTPDTRPGRGRPGLPGLSGRLAAFDAARQKRLQKMTVAARRNRDAKTMGPLQARARDLVMPLVFPRAYPAATNWLYDFEPGTLPE